MVHGDRVRVIEDQHRQRRDQIAHDLIKPVHTLWLIGPEVLESVGGHLVELEHLTDAPGVPWSRRMQLAGDRPVHLRVVRDDDHRLIRQAFRPLDLHVRRKQPHEEPYDAI